MIQAVLVTKAEKRITGLSRYTDSLITGFQQIGGVEARVVFPKQNSWPSPVKRLANRLKLDPVTFLNHYPLWIDKYHSDLYHLTSQNLATLLVLHRPKPAIVTVHDIIPWIVQGDPELDTQRHLVDRWFLKLSILGLKKSDVLIAISEYTRQVLIEKIGIPTRRIYVIPRAVDQARFRPLPITDDLYHNLGLRAEERFILYVGSDDPRKNLFTLLKAFDLIHKKINVNLILAGSSHFLAESIKLRQFVTNRGLNKRVIFIESIPDKDLPTLYNLAAVLVLPSYYEGFGLPVLEAMACGTPVIAANASSLPQVVGDAGLLFDPASPTELADALNRLLMDAQLAEELAHRGQQRAAEFTLESQAAATLRVYQDTLNS